MRVVTYDTGMLRVLRRWLWPAITCLLPLGVALAVFAPVLKLPFFWDDFPQFAFATTRSYRQLWTDATGLPYYDSLRRLGLDPKEVYLGGTYRREAERKSTKK